MILTIFFAFLSGIITILSPCVLPVLPIILTGSVGKKYKSYGIITGFILGFSLFTLTLTWLVKSLNLPSNTLRIISVIIIIVFGLTLLLPPLKKIFENFTTHFSSFNNRTKREGFFGGIIVGLSLGMIWTPCVGPIMASVIALAAIGSIEINSIFIIISYSIGTAIPMLIIMNTGKKLLNKVPFLTKNTDKIQRGFGALMVIAALAIVFNYDRAFQNKLLEVFPNYGKGLTYFEDKIVTTPLDQFESYKAPEFIENNLNINLESIKGKVTIVDFWTYSCINCIRTIPYLKSWYETYNKYGLEIISIHTPEFAFERSKKNLDIAINDLGITWSVIQDNNYNQWTLYKNRYWPAKYIIDANGMVRYKHFGEGDYKEIEMVIRELLLENGQDLKEISKQIEEVKTESNTHEIYLGTSRREGFINSRTKKLENGEWRLSGDWNNSVQYIESINNSELELSFNAKSLNIVVEPISDSIGKIEVILDGEKIGVITHDKSQLYNLVTLKEAGKHTVKLIIHGKLKLFTFTFG